MRERDHPSDGELRRFASGELHGESARRTLTHLLRRCAVCAGKLSSESFPSPLGAVEHARPASEDDYDVAIERAVSGVLLHGPRAVAKRKEAKRIQAALAAGAWDPTRRKGAVRGWPRYSFYEALLQRAWEVRFEDLGTMVELSWCACLMAARLGRDGYSPAQVADFQARAYGEHCNALRAAHQLRRAEEAWVKAAGFWKEGSKDPGLRVRLQDVRASLLAAQQRTEEAVELLEEVFEEYVRLGDRPSAGRALVSRGFYLGYGGDAEGAVRAFDQALALLDGRREPDLVGIAVLNRLRYLVDCGKYRHARADLWRQRRWVEQCESLGAINRLKMAHLEGRIHAGLDQLDRAERALQAAREGLTGEEVRVLRGVVSLELAAVWTRQGRLAEASSLAAETAQDLLAVGVPRQARKALQVLCGAIEEQAATVGVLQAALDHLRRLEHAPHARFDITEE